MSDTEEWAALTVELIEQGYPAAEAGELARQELSTLASYQAAWDAQACPRRPSLAALLLLGSVLAIIVLLLI
jgi:hypothetical protein